MRNIRLGIGSIAIAGLFGLFSNSSATAQTLESKLVAGDGVSGDSFGSAVALHGRLAVVGAHMDDERGTDSGSAYVYRLDGKQWLEVAKLAAADGVAHDHFGIAVAIDASTIVVGADGSADAGADTGAVYVFELQGTQWVQTARLTASTPQGGARFGFAVALPVLVPFLGLKAPRRIEVSSHTVWNPFAKVQVLFGGAGGPANSVALQGESISVWR